jgi:hypothetical protein
MSSPARKRRPAAKPGAGETPKLSGLRGKRHGKSKEHAPAISEDELLALVPGGLATAFVNARMHDRALALAGLGEPSDWDGEMPELPEEIASEDHDSLSNLMGRFASVLSTATWHASKAYIHHGFYKQVADYLEDVAILESGQSNEQKRKAEASTQEAVVTARALEQSAYSDYVRMRELGKTLKIRHATVSRVGGFVADEVETEDQDEAPKRSSRGSSAGASRGGARGSGRAGRSRR